MLEALDTPCASGAVFRHQGTFDKAELTVTYAVNWDEHETRVACDIGEVADEFILAALLHLPDNRLGRVHPRFERALLAPSAASVASVVEDPEGGVWAQRRVRPTIDIRGIEISSRTLRQGCSAAHRWAGYGPRTIHTSGTVSTFELTEAAHYGIGLVTDEGEHVLPPATFVPERWSSARWRFAELVYGQFRQLLA